MTLIFTQAMYAIIEPLKSEYNLYEFFTVYFGQMIKEKKSLELFL